MMGTLHDKAQEPKGGPSHSHFHLLQLVVMIAAALFFFTGVLSILLGQRPFGMVYAGMGAAVALLTKKIADRQRAHKELLNLNEELDQRVKERTAQLAVANKELEAFSYSVAHDLRAPLRHMSGFADLLQNHASAALDEKGRRYLQIISQSAQEMGRLIDDLLQFSRTGRTELQKRVVSLGQLVDEARHELRHEMQGRDIIWKLGPLPEVHADRAMLRLVWVNLISNALKFTRHREQAQIEIGQRSSNNNEQLFFIRDNGVGFDMKYVNKLFGVFQRLHRKQEFEGTGIGLANVQRIILRHGGRTWAESVMDSGATFWFSLPNYSPGGNKR
jgi:light-regulated signal transduction histidine kinase (bacteriophytochrome)